MAKAKADIIPLHGQKPFHQFLEDMRKAYDDGKLSMIGCIFHTTEKLPGYEDSLGAFCHYWFSQDGISAFTALGAVNHLGGIIDAFIREER